MEAGQSILEALGGFVSPLDRWGRGDNGWFGFVTAPDGKSVRVVLAAGKHVVKVGEDGKLVLVRNKKKIYLHEGDEIVVLDVQANGAGLFNAWSWTTPEDWQVFLRRKAGFEANASESAAEPATTDVAADGTYGSDVARQEIAVQTPAPEAPKVVMPKGLEEWVFVRVANTRSFDKNWTFFAQAPDGKDVFCHPNGDGDYKNEGLSEFEIVKGGVEVSPASKEDKQDLKVREGDLIVALLAPATRGRTKWRAVKMATLAAFSAVKEKLAKQASEPVIADTVEVQAKLVYRLVSSAQGDVVHWEGQSPFVGLAKVAAKAARNQTKVYFQEKVGDSWKFCADPRGSQAAKQITPRRRQAAQNLAVVLAAEVRETRAAMAAQ